MSAELPRIISSEPHSHSLALRLDIHPELQVFQGHFEGRPLVPGIAQVDWALRFGAQLLGLPKHPQQLVNLKFQRVIRGGAEIILVLGHDAALHPERLSFRYFDALGTYSQGSAVFAL